MIDYIKKNKKAFIIVVSLLVLGIIAIFTSIRLYRLRGVTPTAPEKSRAAAPESCALSTFNITIPGKVSCKYKRVFPNDSRNKAGTYFLDPDNIALPEGTYVNPGQILVYAIRVAGTNDGKQVKVTDQLASDLEFMDAQSACTYTASNRTITCNTTAPNTVAYRVKVKSTTQAEVNISNTASVVYSDGTGDATTCSSSLVTTKGISCQSKIAFPDDSRNRPGIYYLSPDHDPLVDNAVVAHGQVIVYSITLTGQDSNKTIKVTDTLPEGVEFMDSDAGCEYISSNRTLVCQYTTPLDQSTVRFRVKITDDAETELSLNNRATVSYVDSSISPTSCTNNLSLLEMNCNSDCTTNEQCEAVDTNYICYQETNTCRLESNPTSSTCETTTPTASPTSSPTASPTATPTESPTASPTSTPTATPAQSSTPTGTKTPTPTPKVVTTTSSPIAEASAPPIPVSGSSLPTLLAVSGGMFLVLTALLLVF